MIGILRRLFARGKRRPATRLTEEEVRAIADAAVADLAFLKDLMTMIRVDEREGRVLWHVGSATRGSGWTVTVDDATGQVIDRQKWGVR